MNSTIILWILKAIGLIMIVVGTWKELKTAEIFGNGKGGWFFFIGLILLVIGFIPEIWELILIL